MPEGISVLVALGCDAKAGGLSDEYGEIAPRVRRRRHEPSLRRDSTLRRNGARLARAALT